MLQVPREVRWRWAADAARRTRGKLTILGFGGEDARGHSLDQLRKLEYHPSLRELNLRVRDFYHPRSKAVEALRRALAQATLSPAFEKVSVLCLENANAAWASPGPGGESAISLRADHYDFVVETPEDGRAAVAAARTLPSACAVVLDCELAGVDAVPVVWLAAGWQVGEWTRLEDLVAAVDERPADVGAAVWQRMGATQEQIVAMVGGSFCQPAKRFPTKRGATMPS